MSLNASKCHCMYLGKNNENDTVKFENTSPINGEEEVILGLTIELLVEKLFFDNHVNKIYRKASQKISALSKILNYFHSKQT